MIKAPTQPTPIAHVEHKKELTALEKDLAQTKIDNDKLTIILK